MTVNPFEKYGNRRFLDLTEEEALELLAYCKEHGEEISKTTGPGRAGWSTDEGRKTR